MLLLYSYDRGFWPHNAFAGTFRLELSRASAQPLDFVEVSMQAARSSRRERDESIVAHPGEIMAISDPVYARLEPLGFAAAARTLCEGVSAQHHAIIDFRNSGAARDLPPDTALALFRVLRTIELAAWRRNANPRERAPATVVSHQSPVISRVATDD